MKIKYVLYIVLILGLFSNFYSQNTLSENVVKDAVVKIFDLSKTKKYDQLCKLMLKGDDKNPRAFIFTNKDEEKSVKRLSKKIKAYLDLSDSFEYETFSNESYNGMQSAIINIGFKSGDQKLRIAFTFVNLNGKILLAEFK